MLSENSYPVQRTLDLFGNLPHQLRTARIDLSPAQFVRKSMIGSLNMTAGLLFIMIFLATKFPVFIYIALIGTPLLFFFIFIYLLQLPTVKTMKKSREIRREIVYAGRFFVIEIESGIPLYDAMSNIVRSYPNVGKYFREITNRVDFGTPMEEALNEAVIHSPSRDLSRVLWQIINSLNSGGEVNKALEGVIEQISREQIIEIEEYAKKLNPMAMFYMMVAIIMPTLGMAIFTVVINFMAIEISVWTLVMLACFFGFMQLMFLNVIKSKRPSIDI